jgi:hypothetical protein
MALLPIGAGSGVGGTLFGGGGGIGGPFTTKVGGGKDASHQQLGSPHAGTKNTLTKGDPALRSMGQYGKGGKLGVTSRIQGIKGGITRPVGGLGPGRKGQPGPKGDYSMKNPF